jgi:hypothetical protein
VDVVFKGSCPEDQERVLKNLQRLKRLLGRKDHTTARGRRVVQQLTAGDDRGRAVVSESRKSRKSSRKV